MAPAKKGGEKSAQPAANKEVTRKYTTNLHRSSHGAAFEKRAPRVLKETLKFVTKEMGAPDACADTRINKAAGPKE